MSIFKGVLKFKYKFYMKSEVGIMLVIWQLSTLIVKSVDGTMQPWELTLQEPIMVQRASMEHLAQILLLVHT